MANMSYCRFRNTLNDLQDCSDNMNESLDDPNDSYELTEAQARRRLIDMCCNIALAYCDDVDRTIEEIED